MKKSLSFLGILTLLLSFSFAQEINNVSVRFCNDGFDADQMTTTQTMQLEPWAQEDLCIYIQNNWTDDIAVTYSFPKASFSPGWNQICGIGDEFAVFLLDNPDRTLIIPAESSKIIKETVFAPIGSLGMNYGCMVYQLADASTSNDWWMFNFVIRKALHLNLFVGWEASINSSVNLVATTGDLYSSNKKIWAYINEDGDFIAKFTIKNDWNLTQKASLNWRLYNFLWFEKNIEVEAKKLIPWETHDVEVNLWIIPAYKWLFDIKVNLSGIPYFEFDSTEIDEDFKKEILIKEDWKLFVFSWIYVILAAAVLALIIKIVVPKKKKNS